MVASPLAIHHLGEQQILQGVAVSEHTGLPQAGCEGGHIVPASHRHLVEGLAMGTLHMLHHHIAVDEVRADPGGVKGRPAAIQEHHTHYVIPNVPLLVHL